MWIFFFFYCVDTYHSKGFLVNLENTLCSSAYAPPQTVVSWCTKGHTGLMVKRIPLAKVFLHRASFHVFLALLSWVTWEGSGNQVGSEARRGAEVLQQRGGQRWHMWWRCGLLSSGSFPAHTELLSPFTQVPAAAGGSWDPAGLSRATKRNCSKGATKSQFSCQPSTWTLQFCKAISLAVVPALPLTIKCWGSAV